MKIEFANPAEGELCNSYDPRDEGDKLEKYVKRKTSSERNAKEVMTALSVLKEAKNPSEILPMYNYHLEKYDLSGLASVDIISRRKKKGGRGRWRILFEPISNCGDINNVKSIEEIKIVELVIDYHKGKR